MARDDARTALPPRDGGASSCIPLSGRRFTPSRPVAWRLRFALSHSGRLPEDIPDSAVSAHRAKGRYLAAGSSGSGRRFRTLDQQSGRSDNSCRIRTRGPDEEGEKYDGGQDRPRIRRDSGAPLDAVPFSQETTHEGSHRFQRYEGPTTGRLGKRRLCRDRHDPAARRRAAGGSCDLSWTSACSSSPPATATRRSRRRAAAVESPPPITFRVSREGFRARAGRRVVVEFVGADAEALPFDDGSSTRSCPPSA